MDKIKSFLNESNTFAGITFNGLYTIHDEHFFKLFSHYIKTGINLLDVYSNCVYWSWEASRITESEYNEAIKDINCIKMLELFDEKKINTILYNIVEGYNEYLKHADNSKQLRRNKASSYTSKKGVKDAVRRLHGKKCLCCGKTADITLDHIIPVDLGGKDEINNLQPLCRSCNSSKSNKIKDYRKITS